jgi:hypothetical protein
MAEVLRIPIGPDARLPTRRTLDERLFVRWPSVYAALSGAVLALPPRSRLRRTLLRRTALSGWGAWARGDLDLTLVRYAPDYQLEPPREFLAVGIRSTYKGQAGVREWAADMRDAESTCAPAGVASSSTTKSAASLDRARSDRARAQLF